MKAKLAVFHVVRMSYLYNAGVTIEHDKGIPLGSPSKLTSALHAGVVPEERPGQTSAANRMVTYMWFLRMQTESGTWLTEAVQRLTS